MPIRTPEGPYWNRNGKIVRTANSGKRSWGEISLRQAVAQGVNGPITQLGMDVGLNRVRQASVDAGLLPDSGFGEQIPDFSLGTATPRPIRMAGAYGTFAGRTGTHTDPYSVLRVTRDGARIAIQQPTVTDPFTSKVAGEVDDTLRDAVGGGAARQAGRAIPTGQAGQGLGGLPGTALDHTAGWFIGYDRTMASAVSVFRIEPTTQTVLPLTGLAGRPGTTAGSAYPLDIWTRYMEALR